MEDGPNRPWCDDNCVIRWREYWLSESIDTQSLLNFDYYTQNAANWFCESVELGIK